jgi:ESS family glutamate:Na+ symporter
VNAVLALVGLGVALIVGKALRRTVPFFRRYFIPSSVLGGVVILLLGPEVLGRVVPGLPQGLFSEGMVEIWRQLPGYLINLVFAGLFLGKDIPGLRTIWHLAGPQAAFGQTVAWGQYVIGIGLTLVFLSPAFGVPPMFGALLEIGFEGGHGTAAGLGPTFEAVGWAEGQDLALAVATVGVIAGVVVGMVLINWGIRRGVTRFVTSKDRVRDEAEKLEALDDSLEERQSGEERRSLVQFESIEPLSFHLAYMGAAIGVGYALLRALVWIESVTLLPLGVPELVGLIPLFPFAMIGGVIVQKLHSRFAPSLPLDRQLITRAQGVALDFLILSAVGTLSLGALADNWAPLVILVGVGIAWSVASFVFLARRMIPDYWFERAVGDLGQSLGMTATGLLLMRIVDPRYQSPAFEAFGYKQLLFEPLVGGGVATALSVPVIAAFGPIPSLIVCVVLMGVWMAVGLLYFGRK